MNLVNKASAALSITEQQQIFIKTYNTLHPEYDNSNFYTFTTEIKNAYYIYSGVVSWWYVMNEEYAVFIGRHGDINEYTVVEEIRCLWLFYDFPVHDFHEKLISLILEVDQHSLYASDYAVLLYASLLEDKTFNGLPLSMLHNVFDPVAQQNFEAWLKGA
jgi:hypothetical protein